MHPVRLPPSLSPLTQPNFRLLWMGQGISAVGDALVPVALAFATLTVARSASALGLVLATATLARVISLPIGGVWADRLPRQRVMLASDIIRGLVQATVAALLLTHTAHLWHLVLASAVFSFAGGFFQPASTALTPQTVVPEKLQQANALMGLSRSATWVIGPAISGVVLRHRRSHLRGQHAVPRRHDGSPTGRNRAQEFLGRAWRWHPRRGRAKVVPAQPR